jgi:hypothetical protein
MKTKQYLYFVVVLLALCLFMATTGCDDDGEPSGDVAATDLDCEANWDAMDGPNGRLQQNITVTFRVPDDYAGPEPPDSPYAVGGAITPNPEVPVMDPPKGMGKFDKTAQLVPGQDYTYTSTFIDRASSTDMELCGEYFYVTVALYYTEMSFPVAGEWAFMSEVRYEMGGSNEIVIEDAVMQDNLLRD